MERLDEIAKYKVAFLLKSKVEQQPGAKTTSLFGQNLLKWTQCWPCARNIIFASNNSKKKSGDPAAVPSEVLTRFCHVFAASLGLEESIATDDPCAAYVELVWTKDKTQFVTKLKVFQEAELQPQSVWLKEEERRGEDTKV